jgi:predicted secreted protein
VVDDDVTAVALRPGERTTIRLPGLGTVGYRWTARVEGDDGAVAVTVAPAPREEIDGHPPGASIDELAVIEGRRPGHALVTLEQRRSWENKPEPQERRVFRVTVG